MRRFSGITKGVIFVTLIAVVFLVNSCCRVEFFEPQFEDFQIISFTGEKIPDNGSDDYGYKQVVLWSVPDVDGVEFSIRIETTDEELPEGLLTDSDGWLYYSLCGSILNEPDKNRTIWSRNNSFSILFQSEENELQHIISKVYVRYRTDNKVSEPVSQSFRTDEIATRISMPWGVDDEFLLNTTGKGVKIGFQEVITDIFIQGFYADHFKYRLNIIDEDTKEIINSSDWYSTMQSYDIREISLTTESVPALSANNPGELTQIEAYVITRGGLAEDTPKTREFRVAGNFKPQAMIFMETTFLLGSKHYSTYKNPYYSIEIPNKATQEGTIYGMPFFTDSEGRYTAILSDDLDIRFCYGWRGKYAGDDPMRPKLGNEPYDAETGRTYYSNIVAIDVSLNDQPLPYSFYENHPAYNERFVIVDEDQTSWLRMPVNNHYPITPIVTSEHLNAGVNRLRVRVMDTQMVYSEIEELEFYLVSAVPREQKSNILVIHNSTYPNPMFYTYTVDFYNEIANDLNVGSVDFLDRQFLKREYEDINLHQERIILSASELEPYKLVIWQSDNPTEIGPNNANIFHEYEVLNIYMRGGGNMLISGGSNINAMKRLAESAQYVNRFFHSYFGLTYRDTEVAKALSSSMVGPAARQYFIGAVPDEDLPINPGDIDIEWEHPFLAALGDRISGLAPVTYFDENRLADNYTVPLYRMTATEEGQDYNGVTVALRRVTANNSAYIFGFPLSYMQREQVTDMLNEIIGELR